MRIISKKSDYYDSVQSYGLDENIVFVRNEEEIKHESMIDLLDLDMKTNRAFSDAFMSKVLAQDIPRRRNGWLRFLFKSYRDRAMQFFVIGFCGEFFPCVKVTRYEDAENLDGLKEKSQCFYPGDVVKIKDTHPYRDESEKLSDEKTIQKFISLKFKKSNEIFHILKSPIVAFDITDSYSSFSVVNPLLSEYKFYRMKDAYTAFQDISQYLGGVLGDLSENTVTISDKDMRDAKGFDDWSFKQRPQKKNRS